jgi:methionyl-tRNA formyltransferase
MTSTAEAPHATLHDSTATFTAFIVGEGTMPIACGDMLIGKGHRICGISSADPQVRTWAAGNGIACHDLSASLPDSLRATPFDYLFSIVNLSVLDARLLALAGQVAINFHDGPLPRAAGLNTPAWAILNGETEHGVTWHVMSEAVDRGDILVQRRLVIAPDETALSLSTRCYEAGIESFGELLQRLSSGTLQPVPQDLGQRRYFGSTRRPPAAGLLRWDRSAEELSALVRGLDTGRYASPLGTAKALIGGELVAVTRLEVLPRS